MRRHLGRRPQHVVLHPHDRFIRTPRRPVVRQIFLDGHRRSRDRSRARYVTPKPPAPSSRSTSNSSSRVPVARTSPPLVSSIVTPCLHRAFRPAPPAIARPPNAPRYSIRQRFDGVAPDRTTAGPNAPPVDQCDRHRRPQTVRPRDQGPRCGPILPECVFRRSSVTRCLGRFCLCHGDENGADVRGKLRHDAVARRTVLPGGKGFCPYGGVAARSVPATHSPGLGEAFLVGAAAAPLALDPGWHDSTAAASMPDTLPA